MGGAAGRTEWRREMRRPGPVHAAPTLLLRQPSARRSRRRRDRLLYRSHQGVRSRRTRMEGVPRRLAPPRCLFMSPTRRIADVSVDVFVFFCVPDVGVYNGSD